MFNVSKLFISSAQMVSANTKISKAVTKISISSIGEFREVRYITPIESMDRLKAGLTPLITEEMMMRQSELLLSIEKNYEIAKAVSSFTKKRLMLSTPGTAAASGINLLLKSINSVYQYSLSELERFLSNNAEIINIIVNMETWPTTLEVPQEKWGSYLLGFIYPKKGIYIYDENGYLETLQIHRLPGYEEGAPLDTQEKNLIVAKTSSTAEGASIVLPQSSENDASIYNLSISSLTSRALNTLLMRIDLRPTLFRNLREINLTNNMLDDETAMLLSVARMNNLACINLAKNRLTKEGFLNLINTLNQLTSNEFELDLSENWIFLSYFDRRNLPKLSANKKINLSANMAHCEPEIEAGLMPREEERRRAHNQELARFMISRFNFFTKKDEGVKSIFSWISEEVKINQPLLFVVANGEWIHQHALLLIECLNENLIKEIMIYELFVESSGKAKISYIYPDLSSERFKSILNGDYQTKCYPVSLEKERELVARLNKDVSLGNTFNYHKFAWRDSDGKEQVNCAKWLADHLKAVGLPADLSWLNLPNDLTDNRNWIRKKFWL